MTDSPSKRLRWAREQAGFASAAAFARSMDVPEVTYRAHEKGPRAAGGRGLSEQTARTYARQLGVSWAWLLTGFGDANAPDALDEGPDAAAASEVQVALPPLGTLRRDVPLRGVAVGGEDGAFEFNGEIVDYVLRPPGIVRARDVFAIYVVGSSMAPRYEEGDLVFVHPGRPAHGGCDVLVELKAEAREPSPCLIKRLVRRDQNSLLLEQFNPPRRDIEIPLSQVRLLYRILTSAELLGL